MIAHLPLPVTELAQQLKSRLPVSSRHHGADPCLHSSPHNYAYDVIYDLSGRC